MQRIDTYFLSYIWERSSTWSIMDICTIQKYCSSLINYMFCVHILNFVIPHSKLNGIVEYLCKPWPLLEQRFITWIYMYLFLILPSPLWVCVCCFGCPSSTTSQLRENLNIDWYLTILSIFVSSLVFAVYVESIIC